MNISKAIKLMYNIKSYMVEGNPIWDTVLIAEAFDVAIHCMKLTRWIPCTERLPDHSVDVMATYRYHERGDTYVGGACYSDGEWYCEGGYKLMEEYGAEVIAWMPLPKPYKEGE